MKLSEKKHIELSILSKKRNIIKNIYCIYALINKDKIVYIGQSSNIMQRLAMHISENRKEFDSYSIVEWIDTYSSGLVNEVEKSYIKKLSPLYNKHYNSN